MNQVTLARKKQNLSFNAFYIALLIMLAGVICMIGSSAVVALMSGQILYFLLSASLFVYAGWALGASFVSIPVVMHLNAKYGEKKYGELDIAHSRALKLLTTLPCRKSMDVPVLMSNLALMKLCQGDYATAEELFRQATEYIAEEPLLSDTFAAGILINNHGSACYRLGNLAQAEVLANRSLEIFNLPKNKSWRVGKGLPTLLLGAIHARFGEWETAEEHLETARRIAETEKMPTGSISTSFEQSKNSMLLWSCYVLLKQDEVPSAEALCDQAIARIIADPAGANTLLLEVLLANADAMMELNQMHRAEQLLNLAYQIAAEWPTHPDSKQTLNYFEKLLRATNRENEIGDMRNWLRHVDHTLALSG